MLNWPLGDAVTVHIMKHHEALPIRLTRSPNPWWSMAHDVPIFMAFEADRPLGPLLRSIAICHAVRSQSSSEFGLCKSCRMRSALSQLVERTPQGVVGFHDGRMIVFHHRKWVMACKSAGGTFTEANQAAWVGATKLLNQSKPTEDRPAPDL